MEQLLTQLVLLARQRLGEMERYLTFYAQSTAKSYQGEWSPGT